MSHQELLGPLRTVDAAALWLLEVEALEQTPDTPGHNDPIWLRGWLTGPDVRAGGRLAITRGDLLAGFAMGRRFPLSIASAGSAGGRSARVLHAALPGGRPEEIAQGQGFVLAYPLVPLELQPTDPANDAVVAQLVHDVLGALRADLVAAKVDHWLCKCTLPVPSRPELEERLRLEGWVVQGNLATRPRGPQGALSSFLTMALGDPGMPRQALPPEGTPDELLDLASKAALFPGYPDERSKRLHARVTTGPPVPVARPPSLPPGPAPARLPKDAPRLDRPAPAAPDWRQDFGAHPPAPKAPTRLTPTHPKPAKPGVRREWLDDFEK